MSKLGKTWLVLALVLGLGAATAGGLYAHRPFRQRLAGYVTDLTDRTHAQRLNIERVGREIDRVIVASGATFSLNERAGPYDLENGFVPERSFRERRLTTTEGGGVCQLAGTLYNAARIAGLEIVERVTHSHPVQSVPSGRDATLAYGVADLKLKNIYPFPVQIRSRVARDQWVVEIWGKELPDERSEPSM